MDPVDPPDPATDGPPAPPSRVLGAADEVPDDVFRLLVSSLRDYAVLVLDPVGTVLTWNPGAESIKGYAAEEIIGQSFSRFYTPEAVEVGHPERELEHAATAGRYEEEGWRLRKDGSRFWARVVITALFGDDGELIGFGKVTADLTARKQAEEQANNALALLRVSVRTDPLTGLLNRRGWTDAIERELGLARRRGEPLSVALLDLDRFKAVNDDRGHAAGDRALRQAAIAWRDRVRASDVVARLGGEEFAIAFVACPGHEALEILERVRTATPGVTCSAGLVTWDGDEDAAAMLERADVALRRAKADGRDRTVRGDT